MATFDWYMKEIRTKAESIKHQCELILQETDPKSEEFYADQFDRAQICDKRAQDIMREAETMHDYALDAEDNMDEE